MKKFFSFLLSVGMACATIPCVAACNDNTDNQQFENVILVIGDGMGENHLLNAIEYFDLDIPVFMQDQVGYIGTNSLSGTTDSAAAGTALATGKKTTNGSVAQLDGKDLEQITTIAQAAGMKTGVITTDTLDGATPAAFSGHASNRGVTNQIVRSQATSGIDLMIGRYSSEYTNRSTLFTAKNYTMVTDETQLLNAQDTERLIGLLPNIDSEYMPGNEEDFQLDAMTEFAIDYLENENGFFLMIEGAYIDKYSHSNRFHDAMSEARSLMDTIEFLYEYASDGKTAIFITADHETGGLRKVNDREPMDNQLYTTGDHTPTPVPLFIKNYVLNLKKFGYKAGQTPENTIVFEACKAIIKNK